MIGMLIELRPHVPLLLSRPGGMRWPPGGIIGGAKNSLFEICRCLRHIRASRFGGLEFGLDIWNSVQHALLHPYGAGGGLPPPRGNTAARPSLFYSPLGEQCFVFDDLCDICNIDMHNRLWDSVLFQP